MSKPDNILRFDSANSAFTGFTIEQRPGTVPTVHHGHDRDAQGNLIEYPPESDGWSSTVVENATGVIRGPFDFTGDAVLAMKAWALEKVAENSTAVDNETTSDVEDDDNG